MATTAEAAALRATTCAICAAPAADAELYPANFDADAFTARVFSARRSPDRLHYRMVRCERCGLIRSDPVLDGERLAALYRESTFDYGDESANIGATYERALAELERRLARPTGALLEIGCGNGFFLERAQTRGWAQARGVEPSSDAIARAPAGVGKAIVQDVMRPGLFPEQSFDAVCLFQVLDHLPDPVGVLRECHRVLRPGGQVLALNHNASAWSARLLGERSPIVDVEHTYLYTPATMRALFARAGFVDLDVAPVRNTYSLRYLAQLPPLPEGVKRAVRRVLERSRLGRVRVTLPLGNLRLLGRRAED